MTKTYTTERGFFTVADGTRLHYESDVVPAARGVVLLLHGFAEHAGRYDGLVERLRALRLSCHRFDFRGHGRSGGRRGHVYAFDEYLSDLEEFRRRVEAATPGARRFLVGHSNGGLVALLGAAARPDGLAGLALSSPFFGFGFKVPALKEAAGRLLSRYVPALALPTGLDPASLSHDPAVVEGYRHDPLILKSATARWFTEVLGAHARVPAAAAVLELPVLVQQGGADRVASPAVTREVFERIGSREKTYREYAGLYHEIWFEREREQPVADLLDWLEARLEA